MKAEWFLQTLTRLSRFARFATPGSSPPCEAHLLLRARPFKLSPIDTFHIAPARTMALGRNEPARIPRQNGVGVANPMAAFGGDGLRKTAANVDMCLSSFGLMNRSLRN